MGRAPRIDKAGLYYHVLNRANTRSQILFDKDDYQLFESILEEAIEMFSIDIFAYCIMPNHFHLVIRVNMDGELSSFMQWLTLPHTQRWHSAHKTTGSGHLYQGRYKAFIIQEDFHLLSVIRYVERNPLTANLVTDPFQWRWCSLFSRYRGTQKQKALLSEIPMDIPKDYLSYLIEPISEKEKDRFTQSIQRGIPYGSLDWIKKTVELFNLYITTRKRGRPKKLK